MTTFQKWTREFPVADSSLNKKSEGDNEKQTLNRGDETEVPEQSPAELVREAYNQLLGRNWRLIDAREGFQVFSNLPSQDTADKQNMKSIIGRVVQHLKDITIAQASQFLWVHITIFVAGLFLIMMDFIDTLHLESSLLESDNSDERSRRAHLATKIVGAVYIILSLGLAI
jgi:hypothetical protein